MAEYIEKKATIKRLEEVYCVGCNSYNGVRCRACGTGDAIDMIEDAPAADVAPVVHARWIARSDKGIISMTHPYMCSRCWRVEMDKEPYCNCGAKMDGGADHDA